METISYSLLWWIILALGIVPYTPLIVGLVNNLKDKSHSFLTWLLYLILDCITLFSGVKNREHIDPMVLGFAIGSLIMASILLYQKRFVAWTKTEKTTVFLIITCGIVWIFSGSYLALVAAISSEIIVGIYLIKQTRKYPRVQYNLMGYLGFFFVSILSIIFTKAWTVAEVGFAVSEAILNAIILMPLIKKWWKERGNIFLLS